MNNWIKKKGDLYRQSEEYKRIKAEREAGKPAPVYYDPLLKAIEDHGPYDIAEPAPLTQRQEPLIKRDYSINGGVIEFPEEK